MVDKITIFEPHFDGAQFGPQTMPFPGSPEFEELKELATGDSEPGDEETDGSKSKGVMLLQGATVFLVMFVVLYVVLSKLTGADESEEVEA